VIALIILYEEELIMKEYESVIILRPTLTEQEIQKVVSRVENTIKKYGEITDKSDMGKRKLAYEIRKCKEGIYRVFQFKISNEKSTDAVRELGRIYRITDEIIKFITTRVNEE